MIKANKEKLILHTKRCRESTIPCECSKLYVGETNQPFEIWLSAHYKHTQRGETRTWAVVEHGIQSIIKVNSLKQKLYIESCTGRTRISKKRRSSDRTINFSAKLVSTSQLCGETTNWKLYTRNAVSSGCTRI